MKRVLNFLLTAIASVYFLLSVFIFNFTYALEALGIFMIISMYLNLLILGESLHYDGQMVVSTSGTGDNLFSLQLDATPAELAHKDVVSFKVVLDQTDSA
jgi:hypothetical protein